MSLIKDTFILKNEGIFDNVSKNEGVYGLINILVGKGFFKKYNPFEFQQKSSDTLSKKASLHGLKS